jgi:hypothetical protein
MTRHKKHKVRSYHWGTGNLQVRTEFLESLEEALEYVRNLFCHSAKIYDEDNNLITEVSGNQGNTYA